MKRETDIPDQQNRAAGIAVIAPSSTMTRVMTSILRTRQLSLPVVEAAQSEAIEIARQLLAEGAEVLISRGKTARMLREHFRVPVVEVRHTFFDCINAYEKASRLSSRIAFLATSEGYARILEKSRPFVAGASICFIDPLSSAQTTEAVLDALQAQGIEVAIGGLSLEAPVKSRGMRYVMSDTDSDAAAEAIDEALHLLQVEEERRQQRQELQRRYEMIQSILDCVSEGIFSVDGMGVVTRMNNVAKTYLSAVSCGDAITELPVRSYFNQALRHGKPVRGALIDVGRLSLTLSIAPIVLEGQIIGAVATLQKQTDIKAIEQKMRRALAGQHLADSRFDDIVGSSAALQKAKSLAATYAGVDSTLMIEGETGTGKELFAQSIHNASPRRSGPFVAINCAAFAPGVLESELFGYVKGAFTGASTDGRAGVFELAHTGTLFLDEISETSSDIQLKLLRTLQERKVIRMGDDKVTPVDIRIITASNKPLPALIAQGLFREDFYYRICVLRLRLPPLRERREDIPALVRHLLGGNAGELLEHTPTLVARLCDHHWPGNVRQLGNIVERLSVMSQCSALIPGWLDDALDDLSPASRSAGGEPAMQPLSERDILFAALARAGGNRQGAAEHLGISTTTLWRRMKKFLDENPGCFDAARYG
ncbi:Transcriptional regulator containing PAS, AAA-type ATPase, and DNA-binding Fis domains [Pseudomonas flavescens]|uniref:Transcriptional regulator containing PAS, AAA-type ATPase, and DNA-binding Fis domains n=1 Tax=Phytopseudomonas flavescens TaxID=29435 RepID=A0A1G8KD40_9GAMM|nr:sigma 54-interacting transcriptional regulator [Pseudomonas flavescens]SDI41337.1 Transcriptional regulator containing PAS, AAA-type ATPase, and DNA-binding Fis domains [Pseudomonas flavescens]